jgi:hypothetical protein
LTAAWISALQSMVEVLLVPLVVTELPVDELDEAVLLAVEVALETVMKPQSLLREQPDRRRAGPAKKRDGLVAIALLDSFSEHDLAGKPLRTFPDHAARQPSSFSRYCGIWFAAASADTAAWVFTSADDSVACSEAISTSLMAEFADCRFWV